MTVYLVQSPEVHEDAGVEYESKATVAVCSTMKKAEVLAARGGWFVEEMELDAEFRDSWHCIIIFDGTEVQCVGPTPVRELPASSSDPWKTGANGYGWTELEARVAARNIYDREVAEGYRKLVAGTEERKRKSGEFAS